MYRTRNEIVRTVLETVTEPRKKTHIMYEACLSYAQLEHYVTLMLRDQLMSLNKKTATYTITEKGRTLLEALIKAPVIK